MSDNSADETLRQEGRQEVLDWLMKENLISYSNHDKRYFRWDWHNEFLLLLPWKKTELK